MTHAELQKTRRVLSGTAAGLVQFLVAIALQIALMPLVLAYAGQAVLGTYAILLQVAGYLTLVELGLAFALGRWLSQAVDAPDRFRELLDSGFVLLVGVGLAHAVLGVLLALVVDDVFRLTGPLAQQARLSVMLLGAWGFLRFAAATYSLALTALQDLAVPPLLTAAGNVLRVAYSIAALYLGLGLLGLTLGLILAETVTALGIVVRYSRLRPQWPVRLRRLNRRLFRELAPFGARVFFTNLAGRVIHFSDSLIVGRLFGPVVTSIYYNTQTPLTLAYYQVYLIATNASPEISRLWGLADWARLRDIFLRLQRLTMLVASAVMIGGWFYLRPVISLWVGPGQFAGQLMTLWLVLFAGLTTVRYVAQVFVFASGDLRRYSQFMALEAAANLTLSFALGYWLGPHGVALATVVTHVPTAAYAQIRVLRDLDIRWLPWARQTLAPTVLASLPLLASAALLSRSWPPTSWTILALHALAHSLVYSFSLYFLGLSPADRAAASLLGRRAMARWRLTGSEGKP